MLADADFSTAYRGKLRSRPIRRPDARNCKYKPGQVVGSRTLIRNVWRGNWEARCACGEVMVGRPYEMASVKGCRECHYTYLGHTRKMPAERKPRKPAKPILMPPTRDPFRPQLSDIRHAVCTTFGIKVKDLISGGREHRVAHPRQLAMALARELTEASFPKVARYFGKGDHTTVVWAVRRVRERIAKNPEWLKHYEALRLQLDVRAQIEIEAEQ